MNWKKIIANLAPGISAALGGPFAGTATKYLIKELLGEEGDEKQLEEALKNATPEQLARIKEIDNKFSVEMAALDVDIYKISVDDRKDARGLARLNMWPQIILSVIFFTGYFILVIMLFSGKVAIAEGMRDTGNLLLGVMTAAFPQILAFWYGSSHGSKQKTQKGLL